ncbi:hypothetical protein FOVG_12823 [Fusarium oxysporum f. sp. pisi HDV247]|uniref:Uncharacterized protein n=1 Tax=Fusarium oxysporum f. sp. pisi HDV247 TaxID=1080344 RepID=W9NY60_FUSOX|nr:hypothetical protein FOVG_12823 [Fusarium oxysporum f. sp. pisi HDV247]
MGAVKEQGANLYAAKLANDSPYNLILPDLFAEAYNAAVDYLGIYNFVDHKRIRALGICGSVAGGEVEVSSGTLTEVTDDSPAVIRRFYDFYCTNRGWQRNPTTQRVLTTEVKFFNFYPLNDLNLIALRPLLIVSGTQSHLCQFSEDTYRDASQPKELYWVPNAGHVDLYDRVNLIPFAKFTDFFRRNLARSA